MGPHPCRRNRRNPLHRNSICLLSHQIRCTGPHMLTFVPNPLHRHRIFWISLQCRLKSNAQAWQMLTGIYNPLHRHRIYWLSFPCRCKSAAQAHCILTFVPWTYKLKLLKPSRSSPTWNHGSSCGCLGILGHGSKVRAWMVGRVLIVNFNLL